MSEFLYYEQYRDRVAELDRATEARRRDRAARDRAALPFTSPRRVRRAPRVPGALHRTA